MTAGAIVAMLYIGAAFWTACIAGAFLAALDGGSGAAAHTHAMRIGIEWMLAPLFTGFLVSWVVRQKQVTSAAQRIHLTYDPSGLWPPCSAWRWYHAGRNSLQWNG
jgi:hypothetical protein